MGLFSFVKNAGEKLWGSKEETDKAYQSQQLKSHLAQVGLEGSNLDVTVDDNDIVTVTGNAQDQATKEKIALMLGNVLGIAGVENKIQTEQAQEEPEARFYTVKSGDTLSSIAKSEYGNANDYIKIFNANKPMLAHPDKIYPGQTLRIPE